MDMEANTSKCSVNVPYLVLSCSVSLDTLYIYLLSILSFLSSPPFFLYFFVFISLYSLFLFQYIPFRVYAEYLSSELRGRKLEPPWLARKDRTYKNPQSGSFVEQTNIIVTKQQFIPCEESKRATSYQSTLCSARSNLNTLHFWSSTKLKYLIYYVSP